jgi:hypothetical protein
MGGRSCTWTLLTAVFSACTCAIEPSDGLYACASQNDCAEGFFCVDGACRPTDGSGCPECDAGGAPDGGQAADAGLTDSGTPDSGTDDAGADDGGADADGGTPDAGLPDGGTGADAGPDDAGASDAGTSDAGACEPFDSGVPTDHLAGFWKFDETGGARAFDSSGNGNTGTVSGEVTWAPGIMGNALHFAADAGSGLFGTGASLTFSGPFSFSIWLATSGLNPNAQQGLLSKGVWHSEGWDLLDNGQYNAYVIFRTYPAIASATFSRALINDGRWHHVAGVYDGTKLWLYLDAQLKDSVVAGSYDAGVTESFGVRPYGNTAAVSYDQVRFYSRALSATEIGALANEPFAPACADGG